MRYLVILVVLVSAVLLLFPRITNNSIEFTDQNPSFQHESMQLIVNELPPDSPQLIKSAQELVDLIKEGHQFIKEKPVKDDLDNAVEENLAFESELEQAYQKAGLDYEKVEKNTALSFQDIHSDLNLN